MNRNAVILTRTVLKASKILHLFDKSLTEVLKKSIFLLRVYFVYNQTLTLELIIQTI